MVWMLLLLLLLLLCVESVLDLTPPSIHPPICDLFKTPGSS
jgi:hypothetical protein